jgi:predicted nucleic acid-binding protein
MGYQVLVDTNVLVYAYDRSEPEKQARAFEVLDRLQAIGAGALSVQVLGEFFLAVTRKLAAPLSPEQAAYQVEIFVRSWPVLDLTPLIVLEATRGVRDHRFSFWDAQIWAAARLNQIPVVFSEDFDAGAIIEGVRFVNPFEPDFDIGTWLQS